MSKTCKVNSLAADRITALARRPGGIAIKEMTGIPSSTASNTTAKLHQGGVIFQGRANFHDRRYFGTQAEADHWASIWIKPVKLLQPRVPSQPMTGAARWSPEATVTWPVHADGTPAYKMTIAAPPPTGQFRTSTFCMAG